MFVESTARLRALLTASAGKFELGTAFIPRPNEDAYKKAGTIIGGASVYIMKDRPDAEKNCAWEFVKHNTSAEIQAYWHTASGYYPVTKKAYDVPLDKEWVAKYPQFLTAVNQLHESPAIPSSMGGASGTMPQNRQRIELAIEEVMAGKATPKQALDAAAVDAAKYLSRLQQDRAVNRYLTCQVSQTCQVSFFEKYNEILLYYFPFNHFNRLCCSNARANCQCQRNSHRHRAAKTRQCHFADIDAGAHTRRRASRRRGACAGEYARRV